MANAFARAAANAPAVKTSRKQNAVWQLNDPSLGQAVIDLIRYQGERKAIETKENIQKGRLKSYAEDRYAESFAMNGVEPDGTMMLSNEDGQTVTFVVQDRSAGYAIKDDVLEAVEQVLGPDGAAAIIYEQTVFGFDTVVMSQKTKDDTGREVQEVLGERLMALLDDMRVEGILDQEQVDALLTAKNIRAFRPGTLPQLAEIAGRNIPRLKLLLQAMGGAIVRYIKP